MFEFFSAVAELVGFLVFLAIAIFGCCSILIFLASLLQGWLGCGDDEE